MYIPFQIAIPSYKRARTLRDKTLRFLAEEEVPPEIITVFVANEQEKEEYERILDSGTYGKIVVGMPGLANQRRIISFYYPEGEMLCQIDDDVKGLKILEDTFENLMWRVYVGMLSEDCGLAGFLPNDDGRRLKKDKTIHLTHILGSFFCCRNHRDFVLEIEQKEDMVRSIWYFKKYGKVLRFQDAGVITSYDKGEEGGLSCPNRREKIDADIEYMLKNFPSYCRKVEKKKGSDLVLNWRATC